jgi:hypothetical protein
MWRTPNGDRSLSGDEAALIKRSLEAVYYNVDDEESTYGVPVFDKLDCDQKVMALSLVGSVLLHKEVEAPIATAILDGTIAVLYDCLKSLVAVEIDLGENPPSPNSVRQMILNVAKQMDYDCDPPNLDSADFEDWNQCVDEISNLILWDADHDLGNIVMDAPPELAAHTKEQARINEDYYIALFPTPTRAALKQAHESILALWAD